MIYVYDILVNFQKYFYDFFEWNNDDEITHIRKIPLFKLKDNDYLNIKNNCIIFDKFFLEEIKNKTEKFKKIYVTNLNYVCLISNEKEVMAIKLNKNGVLIARSSLLLDEADDVVRMCEDISTYSINYEVLKQNNRNIFKTRNEISQELIINNKIDSLVKDNDLAKLKFLYFECFGKEDKNINDIVLKLKKEINCYSNNYQKISEFFKLISSK